VHELRDLCWRAGQWVAHALASRVPERAAAPHEVTNRPPAGSPRLRWGRRARAERRRQAPLHRGGPPQRANELGHSRTDSESRSRSTPRRNAPGAHEEDAEEREADRVFERLGDGVGDDLPRAAAYPRASPAAATGRTTRDDDRPARPARRRRHEACQERRGCRPPPLLRQQRSVPSRGRGAPGRPASSSSRTARAHGPPEEQGGGGCPCDEGDQHHGLLGRRAQRTP
jgi:hypothetical protein